jgi:Ca2+-binding EF-hand superfamily protein
MRPLLPILLASLFTVLPALAQEAAAPADPELAALEQEILDAALLRQLSIDFNYNDRCDPEEKALLLASSSHFDLDGNGEVDLLELALTYLHGNTRMSSSITEMQSFQRNYQQQHPGPIRGKELRCALEEEGALNAIAYLANLPRQADWREPLRARLVKEEDLNHNGILDHYELIMRGAIDQVLGDLFSFLFCEDFDSNNDGVLSKAEREAVLEIFKDDFDLDQDGRMTLDDLQVLVNLPGSMKEAIQRPAPFPTRFKEQYAEFSKRLLPRYDRNGDGRWQPLEMRFATATDEAMDQFIYQLRSSNPHAPKEGLDALRKRIVADRDLNGNGKLDFAEIPRHYGGSDPCFGPDPLDQLIGYRLADAKPPIPPKTLKAILAPPLSSKRLSQDPRLPAESLADIMKTLMTLYDGNHDGKLDVEEAWVGNVIETFLRQQVYRLKLFSLTLEQQQAAIARLVAAYDQNHDGRLSPVEAQRLPMAERYWIVITRVNETNRHLDKNGDGYLDADERKPIEQEILKRYDLNQNGMLEPKEWQAYFANAAQKAETFDPPLTPEEQADWDKKKPWFDFDQDGRIDLQEIRSIMLYSMALDMGKGKNNTTYRDLWLWHDFMLKNHDNNQDGRIDNYEFRDSLRCLDQWKALANLKKLPQEAESMPELRRWALAQGDTNHDGKLSLQELTALNNYQSRLQHPLFKDNPYLFQLQKIDPQHPTYSEMAMVEAFNELLWFMDPLYPEFARDNDGWLTPAGRNLLAKHLLKIGDKNGNGRLEYEESQYLLRQNYVKVHEARETRRKAQMQREAEQAKRQQEAQWLKKYDFNGNGKLDLEERTRAEADSKAGIQAPARDE